MNRDGQVKHKISIPLAIGVAVVLMGCAERKAPGTPPAQASITRITEYRAGLDAYAAGRPEKALQHFSAAANQGNVNAQYYVGLMHANGEGTKRDFREAAKWYRKAAARNQPDALVNLARLHVMGLGVDADAQKAVELFGRAAKVYPPGEKRNQAAEQGKALAAIVASNTAPNERAVAQ